MFTGHASLDDDHRDFICWGSWSLFKPLSDGNLSICQMTLKLNFNWCIPISLLGPILFYLASFCPKPNSYNLYLYSPKPLSSFLTFFGSMDLRSTQAASWAKHFSCKSLGNYVTTITEAHINHARCFLTEPSNCVIYFISVKYYIFLSDQS